MARLIREHVTDALIPSMIGWVKRGAQLACVCLLAGAAVAGPRGGSVSFGSAAITQVSPRLTTIRQSSSQAIINWQDFSVGAGQSVQFLQPSASAVTLNRVIQANPSMILGSVSANGTLFLINPYGIVFGPGSQINVSSFVASTLSLSDSDFRNRNYRLVSGAASLAAIVNQGTIKASPGGTVALIAPLVNNQGQIVALAGRIVIGATTQATISLDSQGYVNVAGSTVNPTAPVRVPSLVYSSQLSQAVLNSSNPGAHSVLRLPDGSYQLTGGNGVAVNSGLLVANGNGSGPAGTVTVNGSTDVALAPGSAILARSTSVNGASGTVGLSAGNNVYYLNPTSGTGPASRIQANTANLSAGGSVLSGPNGALAIQSITTNLSGGSGVGQSGRPVQVYTNQLSAVSANGSVYVNAAGNVTVNAATAGPGNTQVALSATGSILAGTNGTPYQVSGGSVTLSAGGSVGSPGAPLYVQGGSLTVNSPPNGQYIKYFPPYSIPKPPVTEGDSSFVQSVTASIQSVGAFLPPPPPGGFNSPPTTVSGGSSGPAPTISGGSDNSGQTVTAGPSGGATAGSGGSAAAPSSGSSDSGVTTISSAPDGTLGRQDNALLPTVREDTTKFSSYGSGEQSSGGLVQVVSYGETRRRRSTTTAANAARNRARVRRTARSGATNSNP